MLLSDLHNIESVQEFNQAPVSFFNPNPNDQSYDSKEKEETGYLGVPLKQSRVSDDANMVFTPSSSTKFSNNSQGQTDIDFIKNLLL